MLFGPELSKAVRFWKFSSLFVRITFRNGGQLLRLEDGNIGHVSS